MNLTPPAHRRPRESIVPMINVVFLLLIFFLMTAQIAPPEPFEVDPPESNAEDPAEGREILHMNKDGELAYGEARDEGVFAALEGFGAGLPDGDGSMLMIRADRDVPAAQVAALMARLSALGIARVHLVSEMR